MGEHSKTKGEIGETTVEGLLSAIGWRPISNIDVLCSQRSKHECKSHGVDAFVAYASPLETGVADIVICSTKFKNHISDSEILKFIKDIDNSASCAYGNELLNDVIRSLQHTSRKTHLLLFALTDKESPDTNYSRAISKIFDQISLENSDLTVIDSKRASFLHKSIEYATYESLKMKCEVEFFYHSTGLNDRIERGRILSGKTLPIEFLSSDILPFKLINQETKSLLVCVRDKFDANSFKRVVGLTQTLTLGWCNKVIICYSDYDLLKHRHIKQSVLSSFYESSYADMIEVRNYNNQLINLANESIDYVTSSDITPVFSIENMLPSGDSLRQLLINSQISKKDLNNLLIKRGVFLNKTLSKEDIIPYFTKSLVSPSEFNYLRNKQANAAGQNKGTVSSSYATKNIMSDLVQAIKLAETSIKQAIMQKLPNSPLSKSFTIDVLEDGSVTVPFEIRNRNLSKDWTTMESIQKGEIHFSNIDTNDNKKTRIMSTCESYETKQVCKIIEKEVLNSLKSMGLLTKKEKIQRINFGDFNKNRRNQFLLCFLEKTINVSRLNFSQLTSIDFTLDDDSDFLSEELISLKNRLDELTLKGSGLEQIKFITDGLSEWFN